MSAGNYPLAVFSGHKWQLMNTSSATGSTWRPLLNQFAGGCLRDERKGMRGGRGRQTEGEKDIAGGLSNLLHEVRAPCSSTGRPKREGVAERRHKLSYRWRCSIFLKWYSKTWFKVWCTVFWRAWRVVFNRSSSTPHISPQYCSFVWFIIYFSLAVLCFHLTFFPLFSATGIWSLRTCC